MAFSDACYWDFHLIKILNFQDVHSVSSLLKMYFRELPNPLCTYYLYDQFVEAARAPENERLVMMRDVVQQLPPPNYRYNLGSISFIVLHPMPNFYATKKLLKSWAQGLNSTL